MPLRIEPETFERLRAAIADGMTLVQAGRHVGISKHAVYMARDRGLLDVTGVRKGYQGSPSRGKVIGVPAWATKLGLAQDYRDLARELGEDYAARVCRQLSAEARA